MQKGIINNIIPNPKTFSLLCKKTIKKNETVIINREKEAINACLFLDLNWKIAKMDKKADRNTHKRAYGKYSFKK